MKQIETLKRLLRPTSIAAVGGSEAAKVIRQCKRLGFNGSIWPVNPNRNEIEGIPCFPSIADLPAPPDASFIGVPPDATINAVDSLASMDAGGMVCYASGFAEQGPAGVALQQKLVQAAADHAIVGPNCHGFANLADGAALWPDELGCDRAEQGAAFVMQSGNLGINLTMQQRSVPISYVICTGNSANLDFHHYIDTLLRDPRVTMIGLHIEGLRDVPSFSEAALRALDRNIPIIALKAGSSSLGAGITMSHTSSLAGEDTLFDSLFQRLGIARCHSLTELLETAKLLSVTGPMPRGKIASMSCSGGEAALVADYAESLELTLPPPSQETVSKLQSQLTDKVHVTNPLDYHNYIWGDYEALKLCFATMMSNPYDCTMLVLDYPKPGVCDPAAWKITERALVDAKAESGRHAALVSTMPEDLPMDARQRLIDAGIAPMQGLAECIKAMRAAVQIGNATIRLKAITPTLRLPEIKDSATTHDEDSSKRLLEVFGVTTPDRELVSADRAPEVASKIGYPVVVKAVADDLVHKTELGAVKINLGDEAEVAAATASMGALTDLFLVEKMFSGAVAELLVGIKRDPEFGLALVMGSGGVLVELLQDTVTLLLPVSRDDISHALGRLKVGRLLEGFRGIAGDREAALNAIESIVSFAMSHKNRLIELDVNPLLVMPDGYGAIAVDAVIKMVRPDNRT